MAPRSFAALLVRIEDRSGPGVGGRGQSVATNAANRLRPTRSGQAEKRRQDDKPRRHPLRALLKGNPPRLALRFARKPLAGIDDRGAHCCRMQHRRQNSLHRGRNGGGDSEYGGCPYFRRRAGAAVQAGRLCQPQSICRPESRSNTHLSGAVGWRRGWSVRRRRAQRMDGLGDPTRIHDRVWS